MQIILVKCKIVLVIFIYSYRFRYAGDITDVDHLSLEESKQALRVVQRQLASSKKNVKKLKQRNLRLEKKNKSLESVMNDLKQRGLISAKGQLLLQVKLKMLITNEIKL